MRNPKQKWTSEEEEALIAGVAKHGAGKWKVILNDVEFNKFFHSRSNVDLKDKWRKMRAAVQGSRDKLRPAKRKATPVPKQAHAALPMPVLHELPADHVKDVSGKDIPDSKNGPRYNEMIFKVLEELNGMDIGSVLAHIEDMPMIYTCHAEIDMVHVRDFGWKYESCRACKTELDEEHMCKNCKAREEFPIQRYRVVITAKKEDAYVTIELFDRSVEKIVGLPISAMLQINTQEYGPEKVYERFENCIGKTLHFQSTS